MPDPNQTNNQNFLKNYFCLTHVIQHIQLQTYIPIAFLHLKVSSSNKTNIASINKQTIQFSFQISSPNSKQKEYLRPRCNDTTTAITKCPLKHYYFYKSHQVLRRDKKTRKRCAKRQNSNGISRKLPNLNREILTIFPFNNSENKQTIQFSFEVSSPNKTKWISNTPRGSNSLLI